MYTSQKFSHLAFMGNNEALAVVCPLERLEPTESELWIHASSLGLPILELPSLLELPGAADNWLDESLTNLDLPAVGIPGANLSVLEELGPMSIELVEGWIVLRSNAKTSQQDATTKE